jgi:hypothetical protein
MPMQPFSQNLCDPDARPEKYPPTPLPGSNHL